MFDTKDEHLEDENCVAEIARTLKRMEEEGEWIELLYCIFPPSSTLISVLHHGTNVQLCAIIR